MRRPYALVLGLLLGALTLPSAAQASLIITVSSITITPTPQINATQTASVAFISRDITVSMSTDIGQYANVSFRGPTVAERSCVEVSSNHMWNCGHSDGYEGSITISYSADRVVGNPTKTYDVTVSAINDLVSSQNYGNQYSETGTVTLNTGTEPTSDLAVTSFIVQYEKISGSAGSGPQFQVSVKNYGPDNASGTLNITGLGSTAVLFATTECHHSGDYLGCPLPPYISAGTELQYVFWLSGSAANALTLTATVTGANVDPNPNNNTLRRVPTGGSGTSTGGGGSSGSGSSNPSPVPPSNTPAPSPAEATSFATSPSPGTTLVPAADRTAGGSVGWLWPAVGVAAIVVTAVLTLAGRRLRLLHSRASAAGDSPDRTALT